MTKPNGVYFIYPEGSCWESVKFDDGELAWQANQAELGSHRAARDGRDCEPSDSDVEVTDSDEFEAVLASLGYGTAATVSIDRAV